MNLTKWQTIQVLTSVLWITFLELFDLDPVLRYGGMFLGLLIIFSIIKILETHYIT